MKYHTKEYFEWTKTRWPHSKEYQKKRTNLIFEELGFYNSTWPNDLAPSYIMSNENNEKQFKNNQIIFKVFMPTSKHNNIDEEQFNTYTLDLNQNYLIFETMHYCELLSIIKSNLDLFNQIKEGKTNENYNH
tara:strand:+ start:7124 stop:7519 length:396 start_codon:yes stop_codon:yes gene_type:complete